MTIEKTWENDITCPYCEYQFDESYDYLKSDGDCDTLECPECEMKFLAILHISWNYSTKGLCKENNVEHDWEDFDYTDRKPTLKGKRCLTCDETIFDEEKDLNQQRSISTRS